MKNHLIFVKNILFTQIILNIEIKNASLIFILYNDDVHFINEIINY